MSISTAQIRGARGLLNWSQSDLAERTGISGNSVGNIESGLTTPRETTLMKIRKALESAGVEFTSGQGVRLKSGEVRIFKGRTGFWEFYQDIHAAVTKNPGQVLVSNADERKFEKWLGSEHVRLHVARMREISGLSYKILVRHGDDYYLATNEYAQYRWMPEEFFSSVPFYVYGDKLAILIFDADPTVIVIDYATVADAYRIQFEAMWNISLEPPVK